MAIREVASSTPLSLNLRSFAGDAQKLAIHLEASLTSVLRSVATIADWVEHRQLAITASYEIVDETVIIADATSAPVVVTLPAADETTINRDVHVKKIDSTTNAVTITPRGTDTIDGAATLSITTQGQSWHLISNGAGVWRILSTVAASSSGGVVEPATATPIIVNFTPAAVGVSVKYAREDHRHLLDRTINATGSNAWTGAHNWEPTANAVPVVIKKTGSTTSAHLFQVLNTTAAEFVDVGNDGHVGFNTASSSAAITLIQGSAGSGSLVGWYKYDTVTPANLVGGAPLPTTSGTSVEMVSWNDSWGNLNHLAAHVIKISDGSSGDSNTPRFFPPNGSEAPGTGFGATSGISFFDTAGGPTYIPHFTFTTPISLTGTSGYTIFMLVRDFLDTANSFPFLGGDDNLGDPTVGQVRIVDDGGATNTARLRESNSNSGTSIDDYYCNAFTHTSGNDTEWIVVRRDSAGTLRCWVDGTLIASTGDAGSPFTSIDAVIWRYIGLNITGTSRAGFNSRGLAELGIFNFGISDADVASLNTYGLSRKSGGTPTFPTVSGLGDSIDLTRWRDSDGTTVLSKIDESGRFGFGVDDPAAPLHIVYSGQQLRIGSSTANYTGFVTANTGGIDYTLPSASAVGVLHNSVSSVWSWSAVSLTTDITGILPIANGGTNSGAALSGSTIMISNGSAIVQGAAGTTTTVLHGNAAGAPTYAAVALGSDVSGDLPFSNLTQIAGLSVLGVAGTSTADVAAITGTTDQVMRVNGAGTALGFGSIDLSKSATVGTSDLAFANLAQGSARSVLGVTGNATADVASIQSSAAGQVMFSTSTSVAWTSLSGAGIVSGTGTTNYIPRFTDGPNGVIGDSHAYDDDNIMVLTMPANGANLPASIQLYAAGPLDGGFAQVAGGDAAEPGSDGGPVAFVGGFGTASGGNASFVGGTCTDNGAGGAGEVRGGQGGPNGGDGGGVLIAAGASQAAGTSGGNVDVIPGLGVGAASVTGAIRFGNPSSGRYASFNTDGLGADRTLALLNDSGSIPLVISFGRSAGSVGSNSNVMSFTTPSDASYIISANVNVTTSTAHSFTVTCTYTDETNTSRTLTLGFTQLSGATFLTAITNVTGAGPYESLSYHIRCKTNTSVTVATVGTFTSIVYNVEARATRVA